MNPSVWVDLNYLLRKEYQTDWGVNDYDHNNIMPGEIMGDFVSIKANGYSCFVTFQHEPNLHFLFHHMCYPCDISDIARFRNLSIIEVLKKSDWKKLYLEDEQPSTASF